MSRLLSLFLILHWAAVFTLLSCMVIFGGPTGAMTSLAFFGVDVPAGLVPVALTGIEAIAATAFVFCAVLFWWTFLTALAERKANTAGLEDVLTASFVAATAVLTLIVAYGALAGSAGMMPVLATHFAALISSYVALSSEREAARKRRETSSEAKLAARVKALGAARTVRLPALVGTAAEDRKGSH